jgi:KamA family protein
MHCRYCFRQNFPYESAAHGYGEELDALRQNPSISEVILSGGDPLSLGDEALSSLLKELGQIPHVERIRFHTRFPIGIPERISNRFLSLLQECPKQIVFVIHTNHPKELDSEVIQALQSVGRLGIPLLNQSVLLRGVNDHPATLLTLCQTLINGGIIPYYLHLLDPVSGTAHFDVPEERGIELIAYLQERLSGYGVPRLAREVPGYPSKIWKK